MPAGGAWKGLVPRGIAERLQVILTPSQEPVHVLAHHDGLVCAQTTTTVAAMEAMEEPRMVAQDPGLLLEVEA